MDTQNNPPAPKKSITKEEALGEAYTAVDNLVGGAIRERWSEKTQLQLVANLNTVVDVTSQRLQGNVPQACALGCTSCCHRYVFVTSPELLSIFQSISDWDQDRKSALVKRLRAYKDASLPEEGEDFVRFKEPCPLLLDGACQIYNDRPLTCRALFSTSKESCDSARASRTGVPSYSLNGELEPVMRSQKAIESTLGGGRIRLAEGLLNLLEGTKSKSNLVSLPQTFVNNVERPWRRRFDPPTPDPLAGHFWIRRSFVCIRPCES